MNNISGVVLTKNNARTIADCVKSLQGLCSEIIIIDDSSDDSTIELVKNVYPDAKIVLNKLERFDTQRNLGIKLASQPWVLMIDSDEIISPELAESIKAVPDTKNIDAYWSVRFNQLFDVRLTEKCQHRPILFRSNLEFSYPVHEIIIIDKEKVQQLKGALNHENWIDVEHNMDKMNRYSSLLAKKWQEQDRNYQPLTLGVLALILPIRYFFICFFGKKFYKAGLLRGLFYSLFESSWWLAVIFKYQELNKKK